MIFTADFLYKLKDLIPVSSVVSRKVKLQKHGKDYFGVCPFHREKTGSFSVNDDKKFYHCFGCGAHGDIFKFIQDTENVSFNEAVENLAKSCNIVIPKEKKENNSVSDILEINAKALEFFQKTLFSSKGEKALDYLITRGIQRDLIIKFDIGYASSKNSALLEYLLKEGYSQKQIQDAGLTKTFSDGKVIDNFRDRVIFPIRNKSNEIVAFGGRTVDKDSKPKYLNSPETEIFKKNSILYLENKVFRKQNLKEVFIVEGYTDAIAMNKVGIDNVVATLGTAITENHIKKLWKIVKVPTICMDGDVAGINAAARAVNVVFPLLQPGYSINFVSLKPGCDPDDIISNFGGEELKLLLDNKTSLSEMIWKIHLSKSDLKTPEQQALFKKSLYAIADEIKDPIVKDMYKKYFSKKIFELFSHKGRASISDKSQISDNILGRNKLSTTQRFEMTIAALVLENAIILKENEVFENFISIEPTVVALNEVYKEILEIFEECCNEELNEDIFNSIFKEKIQLVIKSQLYDYLCGKQSYFVDKIMVNDFKQAISLFNNTFDLYKLELLKEDYIKSIKCVDEKSLERAKLLREQIKTQESLLKERMN